ncbi:Low molecular weight protein-tyrosine-phosphatase YwlE [Posidoniimonas corsicana]|uniref:L-threonylcarbamoyladenylate synthase n=1 Tax=Posidoniimonas corsicana TaxID=1938618 RepID=A0A5C5VGP1_9BACT|nr:L-threonylcarbamoyladenylate synthase [Posidoniimonas corsicana]TWT37824.1 Low molecular weight protein-tyrosine-phosphatase YwlE [Posidoniimonas corsicana]
MPPIVIEVARADDIRDVVHRAVQALAEGELVVMPTETVYGVAASACSAAGMRRLAELKQRGSNSPFALAVKSAQELEDYAPTAPPLARRLARRAWPGPVTLVVDTPSDGGLINQLPDETRQHVCPNGTVGLRCPAHRIVQDVLRMIPGPLALSSANLHGEPDTLSARDAAKALGDHVALVMDDGPAHYGQPSSVVRVDGSSHKVLREGVVGASTIDRLSRFMVLMVCTGNTCRSPMAEMLMRCKLAKKLGCGVDELEERGVMVGSAGVNAGGGSPASPEAAALMAELGCPLDKHLSQQLTEQLVRSADMIVTMTHGHRRAILASWPDAASRIRPLLPEADLSDPIGGSAAVYRACADQIEKALDPHVDEVVAGVGSGE